MKSLKMKLEKIKEIRKEFEMEKFKKGEQDRKICDQENALIQELEWIKNSSLKIDTENHNLMKNYMKCKEQYEIQESDRKMLLK